MTQQFSAAAMFRPSAKIVFLIAACGAGATYAQAAGAVATDDVPSVTVKYDPHMLATDAGAKAMYRRLVKAAEAVCPAPITGSPLPSRAIEVCRQEALARAVGQIGDPRLAAVSGAREKSG